MNEEQRLKGEASRKAKQDQFDAQKITVNEDWRIERNDERNWTIWYRNEQEPRGYYGNVADAVAALPNKMLNEIAKGSLQEVAAAMVEVKAIIERALGDA